MLLLLALDQRARAAAALFRLCLLAWQYRRPDFHEKCADLLTVARLRLALAHRLESGLYPASRLP